MTSQNGPADEPWTDLVPWLASLATENVSVSLPAVKILIPGSTLLDLDEAVDAARALAALFGFQRTWLVLDAEPTVLTILLRMTDPAALTRPVGALDEELRLHVSGLLQRFGADLARLAEFPTGFETELRLGKSRFPYVIDTGP